MAKTDIKKGMRVTVVMSRNNIFPWQEGMSFDATFEWPPDPPDNTYHVRLDDGMEVEINGNSAEFVAIYPAIAQDGDT